jgi:riboflavin synthase
MFTGIVEEVGTVEAVGSGGLSIAASKTLDGLGVGDSVNVNGACLTVTTRGDSSFTADVVPETLRRTNLGALKAGDGVNLERGAVVGGRLDGHIVQGHVDGVGVIESEAEEAEALLVAIWAPRDIMRYVVEKGFIAVDGASLTVVDCTRDRFVVTLIPHTRRSTVLGSWKKGDRVNLEADVVAKYVERLSSAARWPVESELEQ